ncbi:MAG: ATP-dependent zinc metalloprotease FtsH [Phycisphaerae bacterium]|nr:ATP-dependent zinc metalloprotease FtsH [Phycisphaerae bacterium]
MNDQQRFLQTVSAGHPAIGIVTYEEDEAVGLVRFAALELSRPLWIWSHSGGVQEGLLAESPPLPNTEDPVAGLNALGAREERSICVALDLAAHLRQERPLRAFRNLLRQAPKRGVQLVLIDHSDDVPAVVRAYVTPFELALPDESALEELLRETLRQANRQQPLTVDITRSGLRAIVRNLRGLTRRQAAQVIGDCVAEDRRFDEADIGNVLLLKRRAMESGGLLEHVQTPATLDDIGGMRRLKTWLQHRRLALGDRARTVGLSAARGVLMLGVQGAGKSLCAKAIATAWQQPLLRLDVGALYDKYVGESERRLRDALRQAEGMSPIVLWIDEIEKAFASAAARSTDGGLSQRMFGTLLTWMQEHEAEVFLVATANDIEALPPELLRKGRFDEIFFVDLPAPAVRREILAIHLRRRGHDPAAFDLDALVAASDGFSGAEIEAAISAAMHEAFAADVPLSSTHLLAAVRQSPPLAVTMAERVAALRAWAVGRCVPADDVIGA